MEEVSWLSLIIIVLKKNSKFKIYMDFQWLNVATKKDLYPLPFIEEVLDKVAGHEVYSLLDGFSSYHQIMIAPKDKYKTTSSSIGELSFGWSCHLAQKCSTNLSIGDEYNFQGLFWNVHETNLGRL
jgi:hypothetical protein